MASHTLEAYRSQKQFKDILQVLEDSFPENEALQNTLSKLQTRKNAFITRLKQSWDMRIKPEWTEQQIIELNLSHELDLNEIAARRQRHLPDEPRQNDRKWVLKSSQGWLGWDPGTRSYMNDPIQFGAEIDYQVFEKLVCQYQETKSVNLIRTLNRFLEKFASMGLNDESCVTVLLEFSKIHLPLSYPTLSRLSNSADNLFYEISHEINLDVEESKIRKSLCGISRSQNESIHLPIFRIKSLFEMLVEIICPSLDSVKISARAEQLSLQCVEFLINPETLKLYQCYQRQKLAEGEAMTISESCSHITSQEAMNDIYRLTSTKFLPVSCSRLDLANRECNTISDVVVNNTQLHPQKENNRDKRNENITRGRTPTKQRRDNSGSREYNRGRSQTKQYGTYGSSGGNNEKYNNQHRRYDDRKERPKSYSDQRRNNSQGKKQDYQRPRTPQGSNNQGRRSSSNGRDRPFDGYRQRSGERRQNNQQRPMKDFKNTRPKSRDNSSRNGQQRRSRSHSIPADVVCVRCGQDNHLQKQCEIYPYWKGSPCKYCGYYHKESSCRNRKFQVNLTSVENANKEAEAHFQDENIFVNSYVPKN